MNALNQSTFKSLFPQVQLQPSNIILKNFNTTSVRPLGQFKCFLHWKGKYYHITMEVMDYSDEMMRLQTFCAENWNSSWTYWSPASQSERMIQHLTWLLQCLMQLFQKHRVTVSRQYIQQADNTCRWTQSSNKQDWENFKLLQHDYWFSSKYGTFSISSLSTLQAYRDTTHKRVGIEEQVWHFSRSRKISRWALQTQT